MTNKCNLLGKITRQRNLLHNHPLLAKGDTHSKSNKSKRRLDKVKIRKEWLPLNIFASVYFGEATHTNFRN
jgi:hypothetical protein